LLLLRCIELTAVAVDIDTSRPLHSLVKPVELQQNHLEDLCNKLQQPVDLFDTFVVGLAVVETV